LQTYLQKLFSTHKKILLHKSRALHAFIQFGDRYELSLSLMKCAGTDDPAGSDDDDGGGVGDGDHDDGEEEEEEELGGGLGGLGAREEEGDAASDCGSEGSADSADSGFGEDDVKHFLEAGPPPSPPAGRPDAGSSSSSLDLWSAASFAWELCKSDYWILIIAVVLLMLSKYDLLPDTDTL
jgi:hypothetical protein